MLRRLREWLFGVKIEKGCGCVFCDLDLKPKEYDGHWFHFGRPGQLVECTNPNLNR